MKYLVGFSRIFVGALFIFSGLIKLNDPVGFSFKLKEYFAPEVLNLEFLAPYALLMAIVLVIFEVVLGIMLLLGYSRKFTLISLVLMILFFTFLTFYSAYFNKVTDCGCFGDAIPLTPWESFYKDVILLVLIVILVIGRKYIKPILSLGARRIIIGLSLVACLGTTYHVLQHLPIKDFRPYKIGANITEGMEFPEDAPKPVFEYEWTFNVNGEEKVITTNGDYPDQEGEFIGVETKLLQKGYEPPIHDFSIERDGEDYTTDFLNAPNVIVVIAYSLSNSEKEGFSAIKQKTDEALQKGYQVIGMSASSKALTEELTETYELNFKFFFCDETTLKTIVRSNPGVLELQQGTIMQKLHWNDIEDLELVTVGPPTAQVDEVLKKQLDSVLELDQRWRQLLMAETPEIRKEIGESMGMTEDEYNGNLWGMQMAADSSNMEFVERIFKEKGYPGKTMVGEPSNRAAWYVLQHNPDKIQEYLPIIKKAGEEGEIPFRLVAMMEDRYLMGEGKPQLYGTQGMSDDQKGDYIWPIQDPEGVNERREAAGFEQTIEEYAKDLFGEDFEYQALSIEDVKEN